MFAHSIGLFFNDTISEYIEIRAYRILFFPKNLLNLISDEISLVNCWSTSFVNNFFDVVGEILIQAKKGPNIRNLLVGVY